MNTQFKLRPHNTLSKFISVKPILIEEGGGRYYRLNLFSVATIVVAVCLN